MRHHIRVFRWGWWLCLAWLSCCAAGPALAAVPMRAIIVFDNSGSMRQNDPQRLSHVAVQLFLALAQPQDQVGVVAFSDEGVSLCPLTAMRVPAAKQACLAQLQTLRFNGQTTNLSAALAAGLRSFPGEATGESRDLVLLLTDGKLDLGPQRRAEEPLVLAALRETLLPQYLARGIAVYTIAFTAEADRTLLQEMAQVTKGEFRFIANAATLHKAFSDLFVAAKAAESLPIQQGAVVLDGSIQEAALVLGKPHAKEPVSLVTPGQQRLQARSTHPGVQWQSTPTYDMIQLTAPEPGTWRIERASGGEHDVAIIGASTLSLAVTIGTDYLEVGAPLPLQAHLLEHRQVLRDPQRLEAFTVQAELTTPTGDHRVIAFQPGPETGTFTAMPVIPETTGQYGLLVRASSPTVQRQRTLSFSPQPRCFVPTVLAEPVGTVQVTLTDACPAFAMLAVEAGYTPAPDQEPVTWHTLRAIQPHLLQVTLPAPGTADTPSILVRVHGNRGGPQQTFILRRGPLALLTSQPAPPPEPILPPPSSLPWWALGKTVAWQLLVLNLVLGVCSAAVWRLYLFTRMRRAHHG